MVGLFKFLANVFREGTQESFGRVFALPFLASSWAIGTASGVMQLMKGQSDVLDVVATLFTAGLALFTGSKVLALKGSKALPTAAAPEAQG
jgi:hypothetical protein